MTKGSTKKRSVKTGGRHMKLPYPRDYSLLDGDAPFEAYDVEAWVNTESCQVKLGLPDYTGSTLIVLSAGEPFRFLPSVLFDPGFSLQVVMELIGSVGRKRPAFQVTVSGVKLYKACSCPQATK